MKESQEDGKQVQYAYQPNNAPPLPNQVEMYSLPAQDTEPAQVPPNPPRGQLDCTELKGRFCCCTGRYTSILNVVAGVYVFIWICVSVELFYTLSLAGGGFWVESGKYKYIVILPFVGLTIALAEIGLFYYSNYDLNKFRVPFRIIKTVNLFVGSIGFIACIVTTSVACSPTFAVIFSSSVTLVGWLILEFFGIRAVESAKTHTITITTYPPAYPAAHPDALSGRAMNGQHAFYPHAQYANYQQPNAIPMGVPANNDYR